ncbi:MAG: branched-chain amino acid ABC transporter substrate-binding protein [Calditrichaeota bacterium]|nr:branched-chain amino acid ABC transporter substrate-binding protein [Calditrichota bacterium]
MKITSRIILMALCLAGLFTGCAERGKSVKIASIAPMTGESAKMGEDISHAVQLAVDEWNAKGGVLGKRIELLVEDDRADPKDAVSVASKVVAQGVVGVVGHYNSSCTIPASNIYHEGDVVMITPASTNPMVTDRAYFTVFRTCGRDDQQGYVEAEFAANYLKASRIAVLHDKTTYGQGLADEFKKNILGRGEVVFYEGIARGDKDFTAVLTRVKSYNPDLLMFGGLYGEGGLIAKQMRDLGLTCPLLSGDGVFDPEFIRIAGAAAESAFLSYAPSAENIPTAQHFLKAYRARWPEVGPYSLFAYDAANIILKAIELSGATNGKKIAEAIHTNAFDAAIGKIAFDGKGDPVVAPYVMWVVKNGKLEPMQ